MVEVATSLLSIERENSIKTIYDLEASGTNYFHIDVMDGKFVKNNTTDIMREYTEYIKQVANTPIDVHLMVEDPSKYIPLYAELNTEFITFHVEVDQDIEECLKLIHSYSIKAGLAIKPNTKVSELVPYLPFIDLVLVMSVEPGKGGQEFIKESSSKIEEVRALLDAYNSNAVINVDGGVNDKSRELCSKCDIVTAGSYIVRSDDFQEKVTSLR